MPSVEWRISNQGPTMATHSVPLGLTTLLRINNLKVYCIACYDVATFGILPVPLVLGPLPRLCYNGDLPG